jgi:pantoate--beta-alanine ligase
MQVHKDVKSLKENISALKEKKLSIGFVPTMGALHEGHLSLVKHAKKQSDIVVVSIFVNPTQFNNSEDLENYPITLHEDIKLLKDEQCDILFCPETSEMYPEGSITKKYPLNGLDKTLEGEKRPRHFDGVCTIVHHLFDIVTPNKAFFGEKDFQQLAIIKHLVKILALEIDIVGCPTVRDTDGLAKSSRNKLLSSSEREKAYLIYESLKKAKNLFPEKEIVDIKCMVENEIDRCKEMILDYVEIVNPENLKPLEKSNTLEKAHILIAAYLGNVRLIDNLPLND